MLLVIGQKLADQSAWIDFVEEVAVVVTQFFFIDFLLHLERQNRRMPRKVQNFRGKVLQFAGQQVNETVDAGAVVAKKTPGFSGVGQKLINLQIFVPKSIYVHVGDGMSITDAVMLYRAAQELTICSGRVILSIVSTIICCRNIVNDQYN